MGNTLIGIDSSDQNGPIAGDQSSKIDENSIVYVMATLPGENLGQNQAVLNEFHPSTCNLQPVPQVRVLQLQGLHPVSEILEIIGPIWRDESRIRQSKVLRSGKTIYTFFT